VFQSFQTFPVFNTALLLVLSSTDVENNDVSDLPLDSTIERVSLSLIQRSARESSLQLMARALDEATVPEVSSSIFEGSVLLDEQCNFVLHFNSSLQCKGSNGEGHLKGPKYASLKVYANTVAQTASSADRLVFGEANTSSANMIQEGIVQKLRHQFQDVALFFWDETEGDRVGVTLKPSCFISSMFSSTNSRRKASIMDVSKSSAPMLTDVSQIAMNIFASGDGCFSDIIFY
jgi:hypothetical protein